MWAWSRGRGQMKKETQPLEKTVPPTDSIVSKWGANIKYLLKTKCNE